MAQNETSPPWSDLPPELLTLVFLRLPTRADRARFPAVCRQWASPARQCRVRPPSPMPWLVHPGGKIIGFPDAQTFGLPEGARYHNSCGEWILMSRDDNESCFLMNPFTKATIPLPSLYSYSPRNEPVETVNDREVPDYDMPGTWMDNMDCGEISVISLAVCSTRLIAATVAVGHLGTIPLCRPGAATWSVSAHEQCRWLSDMVFFQGKLYALDINNEDLLAIDIVDGHNNDKPRVSRIERCVEGVPVAMAQNGYYFQMRYLLESCGTLVMVRRIISSKGELVYRFGMRNCCNVAGMNEFQVFMADFRGLLWAEVRNLGNDQALFVGQGCSSAVRVSLYDLSRQCIFFLDDYSYWFWKRTTVSSGVYDMKDRKVYSPVPMVSWKSGDAPGTWLFFFSQGDGDKFQTAGKHLQEIVEPEEEEPLTLVCGGTCTAGSSTAPYSAELLERVSEIFV